MREIKKKKKKNPFTSAPLKMYFIQMKLEVEPHHNALLSRIIWASEWVKQMGVQGQEAETLHTFEFDSFVSYLKRFDKNRT